MAEEKTSDPAIQEIAPLPVDAYTSLLDMAKRDWPQLQQPGVRVALNVTQQKDASVTAVVSAYDLNIGGVARREFTGQWSGGLFVQWTPGRRD